MFLFALVARRRLSRRPRIDSFFTSPQPRHGSANRYLESFGNLFVPDRTDLFAASEFSASPEESRGYSEFSHYRELDQPALLLD
jgi:hypothetical protein